jgi:hypothetical protein
VRIDHLRRAALAPRHVTRSENVEADCQVLARNVSISSRLVRPEEALFGVVFHVPIRRIRRAWLRAAQRGRQRST